MQAGIGVLWWTWTAGTQQQGGVGSEAALGACRIGAHRHGNASTSYRWGRC